MATVFKAKSPVVSTVDYEKEGLQRGVLQVPYSSDLDAYGHIAVPVMVVKRGNGPTVVLTGANHGDEYEGPVALSHLMRNFPIERLKGRLIVIPALNYPAFLNGSRTSPVDKGNLNRLFPGDPNGSPTQVIAHYVATELMGRADCLLDFHAGGASMNYLPMLFVTRPKTSKEREQTEWLINAFAPPRVMFMESLESDQMIGSVARKHGVLFATGEFGGGAVVSQEGVHIVLRGIEGVLNALNMLPVTNAQTIVQTRRYLFRPEHFIFAPVPGIFEPSFSLGHMVAKGQLAGVIHDQHRPWAEPHEVHFNASGLAVCQRALAKVEPGNCLGHLAQEE